MSQLYSMKVRRKTLLVEDGKVTEGFKEETYHGVPGQLAKTWQYTFPDAVMNVEQETVEARRQRTREPRQEFERHEHRPAAVTRPEKRIEESTYADAINAAIRSET